MKRVCEFLRKYAELIAYVGLTVLLFCACFFSVCAWLVAGYVVLFAIYLLRQETKLIGLLLYLYCFYMLFHYQSIWGITLDIVLVGYLIALLFLRYVWRVIKREQKVNWKTLVPIGLFIVYVVLPFHQCNWRDFFSMVFFYVVMYVVFEMRRQIDFRYIVRTLVAGAIVSCVVVLFRDVSPLLTEIVPLSYYRGEFRFQGLCYHPNTLAQILMIAICAMLILKYRNKISIWEFLITFVPMFVFGYLTLSRAFLVTAALGMFVFTIMDFIQRKGKALIFVSLILVVVASVAGVFLHTTQIYFERMSDESVNPLEVQSVNFEANVLTTADLDKKFYNRAEKWQQDVWEGKVHFDPGRKDLRELYLTDWSSSAKTMWLGRGISRPLIGQMSAHNLYVQELWKHGIVGYIFYVAIILGSINWKKIKRLWRYFPILIMLLPYLMMTMIEQCLYDYSKLILIIVAGGFIGQLMDSETNQKQLNHNKQEQSGTPTIPQIVKS